MKALLASAFFATVAAPALADGQHGLYAAPALPTYCLSQGCDVWVDTSQLSGTQIIRTQPRADGTYVVAPAYTRYMAPVPAQGKTYNDAYKLYWESYLRRSQWRQR